MQLTEHDFICGDNGIELEGIGNYLPLTVSVVEIILMDETTTICTVTHTHTHTHTHTKREGYNMDVREGSEVVTCHGR